MKVTSESDIKNALKIAKEKFGRLDVAVNCAGIGIAAVTYNPNKDRVHSLEDFLKVITVSNMHCRETISNFNQYLQLFSCCYTFHF